MKQIFVDDHIGGILSSWYTRAALWVPPTRAITGRCELCHASALAEVIDLTFWPHDLVHHLAASVEAAVRHVGISLSEELSPVSAPGAIAIERTAARGMVIASLEANAEGIRDVLEQCVVHRLGGGDDQLGRGFAEFG